MPCPCMRISVKWVVSVAVVILFTVTIASIFAMCPYLYATILIPHDEDTVYVSSKFFHREYALMKRELKIFIYPSDGSGNDHLFPAKMPGYAIQHHFLKNLVNSSFVTFDPNQARLYFIPFSFHTVRQKIKSNEQVTTLFVTYMDGLIHKYSYWNKKLGCDHFLFTCFGIDINATRVIPLMAQNSIRIACISNYSAGFISGKDISVPPAVPQSSQNANDTRTTLAFWAGVPNSNTSKILVNLWRSDKEFDINTRYVHKIVHKFQGAKFCLCPVGSENPNKRITMAILNGCVPVILEDHIDLPFGDVLDWHKFSIILKELDVYHLKEILEAKARADYQILYTNLIKVKKHFYFHLESPVEYDAFHMMMFELWLRYQRIS